MDWPVHTWGDVMLRIHFTMADLARTRVAEMSDPLWETVLSLRLMQQRNTILLFDCWQRRTRSKLAAPTTPPGVKTLLKTLVPASGHLLSFLSPAEAPRSWDDGIERVLTTSRRQLGTELGLLAESQPLPTWAQDLADGDTGILTQVADALRVYHEVALVPAWSQLLALAAIERGVLGRAMLLKGVDGLFASLGPAMRWNPPILEVDSHTDRDLHLDGRGLVLVPTVFYRGKPVLSEVPDAPPTLAYAMQQDLKRYAMSAPPQAKRSLAALLGPTRAAVLANVSTGATTSELARRANTSVASASRHASVLREAGLISTRRIAEAVQHTLTDQGATLLAETAETDRRRQGEAES
ncbi:helix-turn-helix transcriptional regulator [Amycolatopsis sp. BJA-103]|uniref:ArsR/SmtB family transcription factor n=1 Tax=Amycolatopsis sp. BJA-103 TaxID=1911175 RepID=UPI000C9ACFAE|nr:winged helix-turn-helix domain-containing protein [Amycolatopsis sp. BJA-103]